MKPDYSDPTDPRVIALRYAHSSHRPDWSPPDRPPWPGISPSPTFRQWCADRLPELAALVDEDVRSAMSEALAPEHIERLATTLRSSRWAVAMAKADMAIHELTRGAKKPDLYQLTNKLKRMKEAKRRGRTRGEESAANDAREAAAWDIWKLRKVILPRFWPEEARGEFHLARLELGKIVAPMHRCTATEAERAYRDGRFADK